MAIDRDPQPVQRVRKVRHWRQRFTKGARFVWRKRTRWRDPEREGESIVFPAGAILPDWLIDQIKPVKLRRWWESRLIELCEVGPKAAKAATVKPKAAKKGSRKKGPKAKAAKAKAPKAKAPETPEAAAKREARNEARRKKRAEKTNGGAAATTSSEPSAAGGISSGQE